MGGEFRRNGVTVALAPAVIGPLGRVAQGGRNWEGFSNDPYLAGVLASETVQGAQEQGIIACTKHFVANEQEIKLPMRTTKRSSPFRRTLMTGPCTKSTCGLSPTPSMPARQVSVGSCSPPHVVRR